MSHGDHTRDPWYVAYNSLRHTSPQYAHLPVFTCSPWVILNDFGTYSLFLLEPHCSERNASELIAAPLLHLTNFALI